MNIKSKDLTFFLLAMITIFFYRCDNKNEPILRDFKALHDTVIQGQLEEIDKYLDQNSFDFVVKMSQAENMTPEKLREIGAQYDLQLWCAEFYKYHSDRVLMEPSRGMFFEYLAISETPLFQYDADFELIEEKTKIGEENFVAIAKYSGKYRYVNWLKYSKSGESYKLDLIYLLKLEEGRSWNVEKTNAEYIHGKKLPADWRAGAIASYYETTKLTRPVKIENFDKRLRKPVDTKEN